MLGSAPGFDGRGIALGQGNSFCVFACAVELTNLGVDCIRLRVHERKVGDGYGDDQAASERQTCSSTFPHGLAFRSTPRLAWGRRAIARHPLLLHSIKQGS